MIWPDRASRLGEEPETATGNDVRSRWRRWVRSLHGERRSDSPSAVKQGSVVSPRRRGARGPWPEGRDRTLDYGRPRVRVTSDGTTSGHRYAGGGCCHHGWRWRLLGSNRRERAYRRARVHGHRRGPLLRRGSAVPRLPVGGLPGSRAVTTSTKRVVSPSRRTTKLPSFDATWPAMCLCPLLPRPIPQPSPQPLPRFPRATRVPRPVTPLLLNPVHRNSP